MEIYVMDQGVEISEAFGSYEEMFAEIGTSCQFTDVRVDGEDIRLVKGIDY